MKSKTFIEVDFPIKEVSANFVMKKNIRHGRISTLHIWWIRRTLTASRASIYVALTFAPKDEEECLKKSQFITELPKWENSLNENLISRARDRLNVLNILLKKQNKYFCAKYYLCYEIMKKLIFFIQGWQKQFSYLLNIKCFIN